MSEYAIELRALQVERIRNAPAFLDSVFLIHFYRSNIFTWHLPQITPEEVFVKFSAHEFADCLRRSEALLSMSPEIGESAYAGAKIYEEAMRHMKERHPGFSEDSYATVSGKGMLEMR